MRANLNELADVADLYEALSRQLVTLMGPAAMLPRAHAAATRDGKGILFVAYDGDQPGGVPDPAAGQCAGRDDRADPPLPSVSDRGSVDLSTHGPRNWGQITRLEADHGAV